MLPTSPSKQQDWHYSSCCILAISWDDTHLLRNHHSHPPPPPWTYDNDRKTPSNPRLPLLRIAYKFWIPAVRPGRRALPLYRIPPNQPVGTPTACSESYPLSFTALVVLLRQDSLSDFRGNDCLRLNNNHHCPLLFLFDCCLRLGNYSLWEGFPLETRVPRNNAIVPSPWRI